MRRSWTSPLAALLVVGLAAPMAAADSPFFGAWKVILPQQQFETNVWLLQVDREGAEVKVVDGLGPQQKRARVRDVKGGEKSLRFSLVMPPNQGFDFTFLAPKKGLALGTALVGANVLPAWLEKTEQSEIDPKKASRVVGAFADLEEALMKAGEERVKGLYQVAQRHEGEPVGVLAYDLILGELNKAKAGRKEYEKFSEASIKGVARFGPNMQIGRALQLANILRANRALAPVALDRSKEALKLLGADSPLTLRMGAQLGLAASLLANNKKADADKVAPEAKKVAEAFISRQKNARGKLFATQSMAVTLLRSPAPAVADLGLEYARKAVNLAGNDGPLEQRASAKKLLLTALTARGKEKEARELATEVAKLEDALDAEFEKGNPPYQAEKFGKRKGASKRVVLVELFNMVHDGGTVAAEWAFDAAGKRYSDKDVVLLQYQCHIQQPRPLGNALANGDTTERQKYYDDVVKQAGAVVIDGSLGPVLRLSRPAKDQDELKKQGEERFERLQGAVEKELGEAEEAEVKLSVKRDGKKVEMEAEVSGVKKPGEKLRLRFVLVEEVVRLQGANGYRLHRNVVRAMPGGPAGFALKMKDSTTKVALDLDDLRKVLESHHKEFAARARAPQLQGPLDLKNLKVVAFVQDDESKRVLQAARQAVPAK